MRGRPGLGEAGGTLALLVGVAWAIYALWSTLFVAWFGRTARKLLLAHLLALAAVPITFVAASALSGGGSTQGGGR